MKELVEEKPFVKPSEPASELASLIRELRIQNKLLALLIASIVYKDDSTAWEIESKARKLVEGKLNG